MSSVSKNSFDFYSVLVGSLTVCPLLFDYYRSIVNRMIAFISASILAWLILVIFQRNTGDPIRYSLLERNKERLKYLQKLYYG
jgi:hypothetical protein